MATINTEKTVDFGKVNELIADNIEHIFDTLGIEYKTYRDRVATSCPIHDSSKNESLTLFTSGEKYVGNFVCWTKHCEKENGNGAINLVKILLEKQYNKKIRFMDVVEWVKTTTKSDIPESTVESKDKKTFVRYVDSLDMSALANDSKITRDYVRSTLSIPCKYYIDRGFKPETLDKFDIGVGTRPKTQMYMRAVVPVYDGEYMIGCVGRSLNPQCPICGTYHHSKKMCPSNRIEERWAEKWVNSDGFSSGKYFYNLQYAKKSLSNQNSIILVEGQGDVWRLSEAGFDNTLGLFGCNLTDNQILILETLPINNIILALDSDEAGIKAREKINERLSRYYNIINLELPNKDFGDMSIEETKTILKGII